MMGSRRGDVVERAFEDNIADSQEFEYLPRIFRTFSLKRYCTFIELELYESFCLGLLYGDTVPLWFLW